jgi:ketosteroid isomerase-like protein
VDVSANPMRTSPEGEVVRAFNDALNRRDLAGMLACLTEDAVFENTYPAPDGTRLAGSAAAHIEPEEVFAAGDRCVMRWRYEWRNPDGNRGHVRGVDLYRIEGGKIAEKPSYVKG